MASPPTTVSTEHVGACSLQVLNILGSGSGVVTMFRRLYRDNSRQCSYKHL